MSSFISCKCVLVNFLFLLTVHMCHCRSTMDQQQKNWSLISMAVVLLVV